MFRTSFRARIVLCLALVAAAVVFASVKFGPGSRAGTAPASVFLTTITAVNNDALVTDVDADGKADPGDTLEYTIVVTNSGAENATSVSFTDMLSADLTLVGGATPPNTSPIAVNDAYPVYGNVNISIADGATDLLGNDVDPDNGLATGLTLTTTGLISSTNCAGCSNVNINANGSFTYDPPVGFTGADTFNYTIRDNGPDGIGGNADDATATGTVTLNISGMIWFINNTAPACTTLTLASQCGKLSKPFSSLDAFRAVNLGGAGQPAASQDIFIYQSATANTLTTANLTLLANQRLIGQDSAPNATAINASTLFNIALPAGSATLPSTDTGGNTVTITAFGLTAGSGNTIRGLTVDNTVTNTKLAGTSFGTLTLGDINLTGTGKALNLVTGALATHASAAVQFATLSSTSSASQGVLLTSVTGTLTATGGAISGSTTSAFQLGDGVGGANTGGTVTVTYPGTLTATGSSRCVDIQDRAAGAGNITFSGTLTHTTGAGTAILMDDNAAGTITFSGAGSAFNTSTSTAVNLTDNAGATISFTGGGLNIDTTSGAGFVATGPGPAATTGGTINLTGSNNTIDSTTGTALNVVNTTIGASGLTFISINAPTASANSGIVLNTTGTSGGLTVTGTGAAGTGGTISNKTVTGISATSTANLNLSFMNITNNGDQIDENGIRAIDTTGTASFNGLAISSSFHANALVSNTTGTLALTVANSSFTSSDTHDGFHNASDGTSNVTITVTNSTFNNNFSDGFDGGVASNSATSTSNISLTTSSFNNNGANGILIYTAGSGDSHFNIFSNTSISGNPSLGINLFQNNGTLAGGKLRGKVNGNTITYNTVNGGGQDILLNAQGTGTATVEITNNVMNYNDGANTGATVQSGDGGPGSTIVKFTGNTINMNDTGAANFALRAINIESGLTAASTRTICLNAGTAADPTDNNVVNLDATSVTNGVEKLRVRKRPSSIFSIQGISPSPSTTAAQVQSFLSSVTGLATTDIFVSGPATFQISYTTATCDTSLSFAEMDLASAFGFHIQSATKTCSLPTVARPGGEENSSALLGENGIAGNDLLALLSAEPLSNAERGVRNAELNPEMVATGEFVPEMIEPLPMLTATADIGSPSVSAGSSEELTNVGPDVEPSRMVGLLTRLAQMISPTVYSAPAFSGETVTINGAGGGFTLPAGKAVTIKFRATIDVPPPFLTQVTNQGSVAGANFTSPVLTDDPSIGGAANPTLTVVDSTTVVVTSSQNPSLTGQSITLTATLTGAPVHATGDPGGTVEFFEDGNSLAAPVAVAAGALNDNTGTATLLTSAVPAGSNVITAVFSGGGTGPGGFNANSSATTGGTNVTQVVGTAATWDGSASSDWHNAANWTTNFAPLATHSALLPTGALPNEANVSTADATVTSLTISLGRSLQITGRTLTITSSMAMNGGNVDSTTTGLLVIDDGATLTRTTGIINTPVSIRKEFTAGARSPESPQAVFVFPVGTSTGFSPLTANVTAGSNGTLTVKATNGTIPSVPAVSDATTLDRYWTLTETGTLTADLTFQYLPGDVDGTEANYRLLRGSGGSVVASPNNCASTCVQPASDTILAVGVQTFDNFWTAGEPVAPTAANVGVSGRVFNAQGRGVAGAIVRMTDQGGNTVYALTNPFGYYHFDDVASGQNYVMTVTSKQYTFAARTVSVSDNITDLDFIAEGKE